MIAAAGGSSSHRSSAKEQYCDPRERSDCNPGNGNHPGGSPENIKKRKHAKIRVRRYPRRRCYRGPVRFRIKVANKLPRARVRVYIDGHRRVSTKKRSFTVKNHVERFLRGWHRLTVRTRGRDGKIVTKTLRFRRC